MKRLIISRLFFDIFFLTLCITSYHESGIIEDRFFLSCSDIARSSRVFFTKYFAKYFGIPRAVIKFSTDVFRKFYRRFFFSCFNVSLIDFGNRIAKLLKAKLMVVVLRNRVILQKNISFWYKFEVKT